jgi:hypothetical protein
MPPSVLMRVKLASSLQGQWISMNSKIDSLVMSMLSLLASSEK